MAVNKMRRLVIGLSVLALIFGVVSVADATTVDFEIGTGNSIVDDSGALTIDSVMDSSLSDVSFTLSEGDSWIFAYAEIVEITVDPATIDNTFDIIAYLDFVLPDDVGVVGNSGEVTVEIKGSGHCGGSCGSTDTFDFDIVFDPPTIVYFGYGNTGEFIVNISDLYGLSWKGGKCCYKPIVGASTLTATVTLESTPIPEPSTLLLLGSGLLGVTAFRMRRGRKS